MQHRAAASAHTLLLVAVSFFFLYKGGKTLESTWLLAALAALFAVATLCTAPKDVRVRGGITLLLLAFFGWSCLSFLFSQTPNYGLDELLRDGACIAVFLSIYASLHKPDTQYAFARGLALSLCIAVVVAAAIGTAVYALQPVNRFVGSFFDFCFDTDYWPNAWAQALLLVWPLGFLFVRKKRSAVPIVLFFGLLFGSFFLSLSRGATLALLLQAILLLALLLLRRRGAGPVTWRSMGLILVAMSISFAAFHGANALRSQRFNVQSVSQKVTFTAAEGTSSIDERSQFWRQAALLSAQQPWFGWGPYSFRFTQPRLQQGILATSDHAHNLLLKLAAERGVPAVLLLLSVLCWVIGGGLLRIAQGHEKDDLLPISLTAVLGVLAHNQIDYNLQFVGIALPFWMLLALIAARSCQGASRRSALLTRVLAALLGVAMLGIVLRETPYLLHSSQGRHAEAGGQFAAALEAYDRSLPEWFPRDLSLSRARVLIALERIDEAYEAVTIYHTQNTQDARALSLLGFLELTRKHPDAALSWFAQAYKWNVQNDASILRGLLLTLRDLRRPAETKSWEEPVFSMFERYIDAVEENVHFIALGRNVEELDQALTVAMTVYPGRKPELTALRARLMKEAAEERARLTARPAGVLW